MGDIHLGYRFSGQACHGPGLVKRQRKQSNKLPHLKHCICRVMWMRIETSDKGILKYALMKVETKNNERGKDR